MGRAARDPFLSHLLAACPTGNKVAEDYLIMGFKAVSACKMSYYPERTFLFFLLQNKWFFILRDCCITIMKKMGINFD